MKLQLRSSGLPPRPLATRPGRPAAVQVVSNGASPPNSEPPKVVLLALKTTLLASAVTAVSAQPAFAKGWQKRRHHNRLSDDYVTAREIAQPAKKEVAVAQPVQQPAAAQGLEGLQLSMRRAIQSARRAIQGDGAYTVSVSARDVPKLYHGSRSGEPNELGWLAVVIALSAGLFLMFGRGFHWPWGGRRGRGEGGRWVYDRSLGGKMVFVPDTPKPTRSLWGDEPLPTSPAAAAAAASSFPDMLASSSSSSAGVKQGPVVPEWWVPVNTTVYCAPSRKEELQRQAKAALRELEDSKLAGVDYPLSALLALRTLCQEGGGLQVRPRTENGRDAMLRAGVKAALECAMDGSRQLLQGLEPARFVSGLAHDLGVPDVRAVKLAQAEVAARCRMLLIDAEAAYRTGDQSQIMLSLLKLAQVLDAFPLPLKSAEAELLAGSIQQQTSLEFRRAIFFTFGYIDTTRAPILAEMLGFDPSLVMPQLLLQIQAAQRAEQLQQQQQEAAQEGGSSRRAQ